MHSESFSKPVFLLYICYQINWKCSVILHLDPDLHNNTALLIMGSMQKIVFIQLCSVINDKVAKLFISVWVSVYYGKSTYKLLKN